MWTEEIYLNAEAWSRKVEVDAAFAKLQTLRADALLPQRGTNSYPDPGPLDAFDAQFITEYDRAAQAARAALADVSGPVAVTLSSDGEIAVTPIVGLAEAHERNEVWHRERLRQVLHESHATDLDWSSAERIAHAREYGLPLPKISGGATAPSFAATPNIGSGLLNATLDTSLTAPTNITTIITAAANGTQIFEVVFQGVLTTAAGVVNVFRYDGATYHLYDQVLIAAVTSSATAVAFRALRQYQNLILKTGDTLRVAGTVSTNQSGVKVTAHAGDL